MESLDISHQLRLNLGKEMMKKKKTNNNREVGIPIR